MINYMNKKVTFLTAIISLLAVFSVIFLFNISVVNADEKEKKEENRCLFCKTDKDDAKKEKQFADKIKIIKDVFGNKINGAVLAATVMYIDFEGGVDFYYEEDFDKSDYRENWNKMSDNLSNGTESDWGVKKSEDSDETYTYDNEKIDLLTAAAIVMVLSSENGSYNEENYKKALALEKGFAVEGNLIGGFMCSPPGQFLGTIFTTFTNSLKILNPLDDYTFADNATFITNMGNICDSGFIGATYDSVKSISDEEKKQNRKEKIADEIVEFAEAYKYWFGIENGSVCLTGNTQATSINGMSNEEYINFLGPLAQADYSRTGVFASVTIVQAIYEGGWGNQLSPLALKNNNVFGIRDGADPTGFAKYASIEEGIEKHSNLFTGENTYYPDALNKTTPEDFLRYIIPIYAPASDGNDVAEYINNTISIIEDYDLKRWDVRTGSTSSYDVCSPVGLVDWIIRTIAPTAADHAFLYEGGAGTGVLNRGQCVWYAKGRAVEIVEELGNKEKLGNDQVEHIRDLLLKAYGNGGDIYDNTRGVFNGSDNIREPKSGSYIVWREPNNYGHVAIVEEVNKRENTITITEGWANGGSSCPNSWNCVRFNSKTMDLDDFYTGYGKYYTGGYKFDGYVYFLEPLK